MLVPVLVRVEGAGGLAEEGRNGDCFVSTGKPLDEDTTALAMIDKEREGDDDGKVDFKGNDAAALAAVLVGTTARAWACGCACDWD